MIELIEFYVQPNDAVNKRENGNKRENANKRAKPSTKGQNRSRLRTPIP